MKVLKRILNGSLAATILGMSIPSSAFLVSAEKTSDIKITEKAVKASENLLNGDVDGDGEITSDDSKALIEAVEAKTAEKIVQADVNGDGKIDKTDADLISKFADGTISYFPVGEYYSEKPGFITRGEWIHKLVEEFEMSVDDPTTVIKNFSDIEGSDYEFDIDLAANFGVFEIESDKFMPESYVTRDFMAHTLNYCLGFADDLNPIFTDSKDAKHPGDDQLSVNRGWIDLVQGEYRPDLFVLPSEIEKALLDKEAVENEVIISADYEDVIESSANIIKITDASEILVDGDVFSIVGSKAVIKEGTLFSVDLSGNEVVRKAVKVDTSKENTISVKTEVPDSDTITKQDSAGFAYVDYDNIEILTEGVKLTVEEEKTPVPQGAPHNISGDINVDTKKLNFSIPVGDVTINGGISSLKVPYALVTNGIKIEKFKVGADAVAYVSGTVGTGYSQQIPIAKVPVIATGGFNIVVTFSVLISAKGSVTVTYTAEAIGIAEYTKANGWRIDKDFKSKGFDLEAKVEEKVAAKLAVTADVFGAPVGELYVLAGEEGKAIYKQRNNNIGCTNIAAYCIAEVGANFSLPLVGKWAKTYQYINAGNSPIFLNWHFENGNLVSKCSFGDDMGRDAYSRLSGGGYWNGSYSSYSGMFGELTPPSVISTDTILEEDTTFYYGLVITDGAKLDLNGHKLTVKGDLTIEKNAKLYFNSGKAEISGKYIHNSGGLIMDSKDDYMLVEGDATINGGNSISAGTIEFKGNITGNGPLGAQDMNKVILSSTEDQTINVSTDGEFFNLLEVKNSEKRNIIVYQYLRVYNSFIIDGKSLNIICNENGNKSAVFRVAEFSGDTINVVGDIKMYSCDFNLKEFNVDGNLTTLNLGYGPNGARAYHNLHETTLNVKGDFGGKDIGNATAFNMGSGSINVDGDFSFQGYGASFEMSNKLNKITVGGNFYFNNNAGGGSRNNGVIEVKGDVSLESVGFDESNKFVLSGEKDTEIYFKRASINNLEIQNSDKKKITLGGDFDVNNTNCGENPLNVICTANTGYVTFGTLTCSELTVDGKISIDGDNKFMCPKATFNNDLSYSDDELNLNGCETVVKGNYYQESGYINLATAKMSVENFTINAGNVNINKGVLTVNGDMTLKGYIVMDNAADSIIVKGDMNTDSKNEIIVKSGSLTLYGDYSAENNPLKAKKDGDFKFILASDKDQTLSIDKLLTYEDSHNFNVLDIKNSDTRNIILQGYLDTENYVIDGDALNIKSEKGSFVNLKLISPVNVEGSLSIEGKTVNLNGNELNVNGNLIHKSGTVQINKGKFTVNDYLMLTDEDSAVFGTSDGVLDMTHDEDYVLVNGRFVTNTTKDHSKYLTAGTLEIKGDFEQLKDGTEYAFPASGTHRVILSGEESQNVTFESYDKSHFNELGLKQSIDNYSFSDNPCWETLSDANAVTTETTTETTTTTKTTTTTTSTSTTSTTTKPVTTTTSNGNTSKLEGDVNNDGSVNLLDVVILRKFIVGGYGIELDLANGDVNNDGNINLADVVRTRRIIVGGYN